MSSLDLWIATDVNKNELSATNDTGVNMKFAIASFVLATIALPCQAADKAPVFNDQEQAAMHGVCDAAIRASGLSPLTRNAIFLCDKLDAAGPPAPPAPPIPTPAK